jgi:hypothetical protein
MTHTTRNMTRALLSFAVIALISACASTPPTPTVDYKSD